MGELFQDLKRLVPRFHSTLAYQILNLAMRGGHEHHVRIIQIKDESVPILT